MAGQNALNGHEGTFRKTVPGNSVKGITRAGWTVPACRVFGRKNALVEDKGDSS